MLAVFIKSWMHDAFVDGGEMESRVIQIQQSIRFLGKLEKEFSTLSVLL